MKRYLTLALKIVLLLVLLLGGAAGYGLYRYSPLLDELKPKDPEKYALMVEEAKAIHLPTAQKLFIELDQMTPNDVIMLRVTKFRKKWDEDLKFRFETLRDQVITREEHREQMQKEYAGRVREDMRQPPEEKAEWLLVAWEKMEPWRKSLLLREKCAQRMEQEIWDNLRRENVRALPRNAVFLEQPGTSPLTPSEFCEKWIPTTHDERLVDAAIKNLKKEMNYFYYIEMLDELGIPVNKELSFLARSKRWVGDFPGE